MLNRVVWRIALPVCLLQAGALLAADPATDVPTIPTFEVTFGGVDFDRGIAVTAAADGGYLVTGYTTSSGAGAEDVYVVRTDAAGTAVLTRTYGGPAEDCGWSIHELADGGYIVAGYTSSFGAGGNDGYLLRTDAAGDTLWTRTYGGPKDDILWSALPLEDGGFALAGQTASAGAGDLDAFLIRTDSGGRVQWERTFGGTAVDRVFSIARTAGGGFLVAGITYSFGAGDRDGYVICTDADGRTLWERPFGSAGYDVLHSVVATSDDGCLLVGYSDGLGGSGGHDGWALKLDSGGQTEWTALFGGALDDRALGGVETPDGGYALTGFTVSTDGGGLDAYLVKLGAEGDVRWTRRLGGRAEDSGYGLIAAGDGGLVVVGLTRSSGAGDADVYLVKTDGLGVR